MTFLEGTCGKGSHGLVTENGMSTCPAKNVPGRRELPGGVHEGAMVEQRGARERERERERDLLGTISITGWSRAGHHGPQVRTIRLPHVGASSREGGQFVDEGQE